MTSFSDYVERQSSNGKELPLVHTTEYFRLASIQSNHTLQTTDCKVFGKPILYFFYGRPAYRDCSHTTPVRDVGFCPVCFVFGPATICKKAHKMFPFDT